MNSASYCDMSSKNMYFRTKITHTVNKYYSHMDDLQALTEIENQISQLQSQKEKILASHMASVIAEINQKIAAYGLTPGDLKFKTEGTRVDAPKVTKKAVVKYRDGSGNTWSGRGLKPKWLTSALAGGAQLSEFEV